MVTCTIPLIVREPGRSPEWEAAWWRVLNARLSAAIPIATWYPLGFSRIIAAPCFRENERTPIPRDRRRMMDSHELKTLLEAVRDGRVPPAHAAERLLLHPFQDA